MILIPATHLQSLLAVNDLAVKLVGLNLDVGADLLYGDAQMFLDICKILGFVVPDAAAALCGQVRVRTIAAPR